MKTRRIEFFGTLSVGLVDAKFAREHCGTAPQILVRNADDDAALQEPGELSKRDCSGPDGLWIAKQKSDNAHLVDWSGKLLNTVKTESKNTREWGLEAVTSGWLQYRSEWCFSTDTSSKTNQPSPD